jgi:hypothetical protein
LPKCYAQRVIPNNTQKKRKLMKMPPEDKVKWTRRTDLCMYVCCMY